MFFDKASGGVRFTRRAAAAVFFTLMIFSLLPSLYAQTADDELFGGTASVSSDDELFGGSPSASSDDEIFGGSPSDSGDDDLFGGIASDSGDEVFDDPMINDIVVSEESSKMGDTGAIYDEGVIRFGCSFSATADFTAGWYDAFKPAATDDSYIKDGFKNTALKPVIDSSIFFDARITENFRIYTKLKFDFPFASISPFADEDYVTEKVKPWKVSVFELFMDYSIADRVFFRLGKHTVTWGVGYFFSPADVINLSSVDPENPTEQREGAISLRTQIIFPGTQNCLWLYVLPEDHKEPELKYTAGAAKFEFLAGKYEIGVGGWYKYGRTPRAVATITGPLGNASIFGEAVLGYGTEEQWRPLSHGGSGTVPYGDMKPVFQGTAGFSYSWSRQKISLSGQYFFNGFGSKEPKKLSLGDFLSLKNQYNYVGRHYLAFSLTKSEFIDRDMSATLYSLINIGGYNDFNLDPAVFPLDLSSGISGIIQGSINYKFNDKWSLSTGPMLIFGKEGCEFTRAGGYPAKSTFLWKLSIKYDAGKFSDAAKF